MYISTIKKVEFIFLLLLFLQIFSSEKKSMPLYIMGTATALLIGKLAYNYYQTHHINPEQIIEESQNIFTTIEQENQKYYDLYYNDSRISDWDLKAMIIKNNTTPYPFLMYYITLCDTLYLLQKYLVTISRQLIKIETYKKNLKYKNAFLYLETKGKKNYQHISTTISFMTSLKIRIQLFKEYNEDCYYSKYNIDKL